MKSSTKLYILIFLLGIVPFSLISLLNYNYSKNALEQEVIKNLETFANRKKNILNLYLEHIKNHVIYTALKPFIVQNSKELIRAYSTNNEKKYNTLIKYSDKLTNNYLKMTGFYDLLIISKTGDIVYTIRKEDDFKTNLLKGRYRDTQLAKSFKETLKTKKLSLSGFRPYKPSHKPAAFLSVPLFDKKEMIGVLTAQIDIDILYKITQDNTGLGKSGETVIATKSDKDILFLNSLKFEKNSAFNKRIKLGSNKAIPLQKAVIGEAGSGVYFDYRGVKVIASWVYIPVIDMGLVVKQDMREAFQSVYEMTKWSATIFLVLLILILYIYSFIAKKIRYINLLKSRYEEAIEGANEGLWDWDISKNSLYLSPKSKEMIGYKDEEFESTLENWYRQIHPDDLIKLKQTINDSKKYKKSTYTHTYRIKHKNGNWIWILTKGKTVFDKENKKAIRILGFHSDITKEKNLELELKHSKMLFDLFMENVPFMVVIKDDTNKVLYANNKTKQFLNKNIIGKRAKENVNEKYAPKLDKITDTARESGHYEEIIEFSQNNKTYYFRVIAFAIPQSDGKIYAGATYNDITENYIMKRKLEEKEKIILAQSRHAAMGEMIGMIAHQWRQPVSVISMSINNILIDMELGEKIDRQTIQTELNLIVEQIEYLSKTIDDFRNFFKPNKTKELVFVSHIMEETLKIVNQSFKNNNIDVILNDRSKSKTLIYSRELLQVFMSILNNAKDALVKNRENNRQVYIDIYEENNITIKICDNAGGIDDDTMPYIFEPYFSTKKEQQGTGLGLYMSKVIIERHIKGNISAKNSKDGVCFIIELKKETNEQMG